MKVRSPFLFSRYARHCVAIFIISIVLLSLFSSAAFGAAPHKKSKVPHKRVVIFSLPRVTWKALSTADTPHIDSLMSRGSVAAMSVHAVGSAPTPAQGYATISAGNRATAADPSQSTFLHPDEVISGDRASTVYRDQRGATKTKDPAALGIGFESSLRANSHGLYDSKLGSFAQALQRKNKSIAVFGNADSCTTDSTDCFDRSVGYLGTDSNGIVRHGDVSRDLLGASNDSLSTQLSLDNNIVAKKVKASIAVHDVTAVECSNLERVERARASTRKSVSDQDFRQAIEKCDDLIGKILPSLSLSRDQIYILSPSAPSAQDQTTVFLAAGQGIPRGYASSATTRREGVVTLVDIAPTILTHLNISLPKNMGDTLLDWHKNSTSNTSRTHFLIKMNNQAIARDNSIKPATLFHVIAVIISILVAMIAFTRAEVWKKVARFFALMAMSIPTFTYILQPVMIAFGKPFRFIVALIILSALSAGIFTWAAKKWNYVHLILVIVTINIAVQAIDILTGGSLQFNSVFGYSPVIAGRFAGFGNQSFAIVAISAVIFVAMVKEITSHNSAESVKRINAFLVAFLIGIVILDGAPYFGSDVGGVLALTPTIFVIGMMLYGRRISLKTFFLSTIVTLGAITTFAFIDLARPASQRTHLGRFAQSLMEGSAGVIIERKLQANLRILTASVSAFIVVVSILYILFLLLHRERYLHKTNVAHVGFRYIALPGIVVAVLGMLLNDSGVSIPAMMFAIAIPALTLLAMEKDNDTEEPSLGGVQESVDAP